jgi:hypothetical protein
MKFLHRTHKFWKTLKIYYFTLWKQNWQKSSGILYYMNHLYMYHNVYILLILGFLKRAIYTTLPVYCLYWPKQGTSSYYVIPFLLSLPKHNAIYTQKFTLKVKQQVFPKRRQHFPHPQGVTTQKQNQHWCVSNLFLKDDIQYAIHSDWKSYFQHREITHDNKMSCKYGIFIQWFCHWGPFHSNVYVCSRVNWSHWTSNWKQM